MVANEPKTPLGMKMVAIEADDARGFLTAVLKRMQTERRQCGRILMIEDAENPARLVQPILIQPAQSLILKVNVVDHARPRFL
jgi:hypothetical protein